MKEGLRWRIALTLVVAVLGLAYTLPSIPAVKSSPLQKILPDTKVNLGLDLMGGIHLTLGVDVDKALENALSQTGQDLRELAQDEGIFLMRPRVVAGERLEFILLKDQQKTELEDLLKKQFTNLAVAPPQVLNDGRVKYTLSFKQDYKKYVSDLALDQAVKTIRNRIDQFGVSEPDIRKQQDNRIQVQLPGLKDPERAIQIIGKTAHLEFKLVRDDVDPANAAKGIVPPGTEVREMQQRSGEGAPATIVVNRESVMTGENIVNAHASFDQFNQPYVVMDFNERGARIFENVTGEYKGQRLAIVLDGKVYSAPVIQDKIRGGRASITGRFSDAEAHDLALVLRAGALPAPVNILEERSVGPSLGQQSIDQGVMAALAGGALVVVFMIVYYGFAGIVANIALGFTLLLILAGLSGFGATLTLPGIAGIILTLGMAVDANVLIFERIREELRNGLTPRAAIQEGYSRATLTIVDANVTTIIAAVILYQFGTGPIRGFAVTLSLGILASMFTAIFVSRVLMDLWSIKRQGQKLSI
ncbi:protein translocase subunit SecD [Oleidesulfovibrio sp.]|uniref:protein translocase subunit SecD n=1 Tax=Oleidesulfovibrio sp. TaxID=2909707 RepID=UPI003A8BC646